MKIDPDRFFRMRMKDWVLLRKGWQDNQLQQQLLTRMSTRCICMAFGVKAGDFDQLWPDPMAVKSPNQRTVVYKGLAMTKRQRDILLQSKKAAGEKRAAKMKNNE
jgi:hypothetical protein